MRGKGGIQLLAFCGTRKLTPPKPEVRNADPPAGGTMRCSTKNTTGLKNEYLKTARGSLYVEYRDKVIAAIAREHGNAPPIVLTCGEPAGIAPEITAMAWARCAMNPALLSFCWAMPITGRPRNPGLPVQARSQRPAEAAGVFAAGACRCCTVRWPRILQPGTHRPRHGAAGDRCHR